MKDLRNTISAVILPKYETALRWALILFAQYEILWILMQYVIWKLPYEKYGKRAGVVIIMAVIVYLIMVYTADRSKFKEIRSSIKDYCSFEQFFLIMLFFWYILVCAVLTKLNGNPYFAKNDGRLFTVWYCAFLLFPFYKILGKTKGEKYAKSVIEGMMHVTMSVYTSFSLWGLTKFFNKEEVLMPSGYSITTYQGTSLMFGSHRNITGACAAVMIALCIYMIVNKRKWLRILYMGAATVHATVVVLSNSRTSFVAVVFMVVCVVVVGLWDKVRPTKRASASGSDPRKMAIRLIVGVAVSAICIAVLIYVRKLIMSMSASAMNEQDMLKIREFTNLSGRHWIWPACIKIMKESKRNFLFGVTPAYVRKTIFETGLIGETPQPHAHNILLQIGVSLGVPAMIAYAIYLASLCVRCLRVILYKMFPREGEPAMEEWVVAVIVLFLILIETVEVMTFAINRVNVPVYHILTGWLVSMDRSLSRKNR